MGDSHRVVNRHCWQYKSQVTSKRASTLKASYLWSTVAHRVSDSNRASYFPGSAKSSNWEMAIVRTATNQLQPGKGKFTEVDLYRYNTKVTRNFFIYPFGRLFTNRFLTSHSDQLSQFACSIICRLSGAQTDKTDNEKAS